jgi:hypothetical protein
VCPDFLRHLQAVVIAACPCASPMGGRAHRQSVGTDTEKRSKGTTEGKVRGDVERHASMMWERVGCVERAE